MLLCSEWVDVLERRYVAVVDVVVDVVIAAIVLMMFGSHFLAFSVINSEICWFPTYSLSR